MLYFEAYIVMEYGPDSAASSTTSERGRYTIRRSMNTAKTPSPPHMGAEAKKNPRAPPGHEPGRRSVERMKEDMKETGSELKLKKLAKRIKLIESFIFSKNRPEWMIMTVIPSSSRRNCARWCRLMAAGLRDVLTSTISIAGHQPQQPPEAPHRAARQPDSSSSQREAHASGSGRCAVSTMAVAAG